MINDETTSQIGAYNFGLIRHPDGTYESVVKGKVETREEPKPVITEPRYFTIPSSSDPSYPHTVTVHLDGAITCDSRCPGFGYRHNCSHCDTVREILAKESLNGNV